MSSGVWGEDQVEGEIGVAKNTKAIKIDGHNVRPDFVTPKVKGSPIAEVKNVRWLGGNRVYTQLSRYIKIANQRGGRLTLYIRGGVNGTDMSVNVQGLLIKNRVIIKFIPGT